MDLLETLYFPSTEGHSMLALIFFVNLLYLLELKQNPFGFPTILATPATVQMWSHLVFLLRLMLRGECDLLEKAFCLTSSSRLSPSLEGSFTTWLHDLKLQHQHRESILYCLSCSYTFFLGVRHQLIGGLHTHVMDTQTCVFVEA